MEIPHLFKPDSPSELIRNEAEIKKKYRYWRLRVFYSMYIGYAFFYFTRKAFTFTMPALIADMGFQKAELGFLGSVLAISYAISKFLGGVISDKTNLRFFMAIGLILTGFCNIFLGLSSTIPLFAIFIGCNGVFQGWGAPPCAKLLTAWYSQTERGRWWGVWNTSHNVGGALIPLIVALAIQWLGWRFALYLPGMLAMLIGFFIMNRLRDKPESLGLPPIEEFRSDYATSKIGKKRTDAGHYPSTKELLVQYVLKNKFIWVLAISFFFVYIIRQSINDWIQLYLIESKGYTLMMAGSGVFWFEIGGFFGSLVSGWMSDTIFKGRRGPVNILFCLGVVVTLIALWLSPASHIAVVSTILFFVGFLIFGPQMLIGMAAAELAEKEAAGTATGFVGFFAYLGAATAGYPVGKVTQEYGWTGFFIFLAFCASISILLLLPLWSAKSVSDKPVSEPLSDEITPA